MSKCLQFVVFGSGRLATELLRSWARRSQGEGDGAPRLIGLGARDAQARAALCRDFGVPEWHVPGSDAAAGDPAAARPDLLYFAVRDDAVPSLARELDNRLDPRCAFVHASGAAGPELFGPLDRALGQLHPLRSLQDGAGLEGSSFVAQCGARLEAPLRELTDALSSELRVVPRLGTGLYHAAASLLANGACALVADALVLFERASRGKLEQRDVLRLLESVVAGLRERSPEEVLTGPVRRGEAQTLERHLQAIELEAPELRALYVELQRRTLALARRAGEGEASLRGVEDVLRG